MLSFKDKLGRQWICRVDIAAIRRVRALCNVDLANSIIVHPDGSVDTDVLQRLSEDPCLLVDSIFAVCKEQADKQGVTDTQFAEAFDGDTIEAATVALLEGVIEFFPLPKRRLLTRLLAQIRQRRQQAEKMLAEIEADGTLDSILESAADPPPTSSPSAPPSSE